MTRLIQACICTIPVLLYGCASGSNIHNYTQAQLTAMTTRHVDASFDETFQAATDALFDGGYTIAQSDHEAGIITGYQRDSKEAERFWISPYMQDTEFRISALMREIGPTETTVRLSSSRNGEPYVSEEAIDDFWRLMQRQVLIQAPPPEEGD